jgi:hypothetical protein
MTTRNSDDGDCNESAARAPRWFTLEEAVEAFVRRPDDTQEESDGDDRG